MKILNPDELIELGTFDESLISDSQERLRPIVGEIVEWDWLAKGVAAGNYKAIEVRKNGVAQYRYFYHLNDQKFLTVNASVFVGPGRPDSWLWLLGADMIGKMERARGIICTTNRRGHVEQCERVGFEILGVRLFRKIDLDETF